MLETQVSRFIETHPQARFVIAYSGGVDSLVLLHAMKRLLSEMDHVMLEAVHVNHNLHEHSANWAQHCRDNCQQLDIPLSVHTIDVGRCNGESLEAKARDMRYACLADHVNKSTAVLTAHHQDDQAETLLLQLMRGSGPKGLASMPDIKSFKQGYLGRPLLAVSRSDILSYAKHHELRWIEDPSNLQTDYDRNYIRQKVLPLLQQRWPSASTVMARSALQCASMSNALQSLTKDLLRDYCGSKTNTLSKALLQQRSVHDIQALIRCWLQQNQMSMPSTKQFDNIVADVVLSSTGATPCVRWGEYEIRRYRDDIYIGNVLPAFAQTHKNMTPDDTLFVPGLGEYYFEQSIGKGFCWPEQGTKTLQIQFRKGGEICQPVKRGHRHKLKKLLQELAVPAWQRDRLPLLFDGSKMVAVADLVVCEPFGAEKNDTAYLLKRRELIGEHVG